MKLTEIELGEIRAIHDLIRKEQWKLGLVQANTAFVPNGQDWCKQQEAIINLLNNEKTNFISSLCASKGIKGEISLDLETGEITEKEKKDE